MVIPDASFKLDFINHDFSFFYWACRKILPMMTVKDTLRAFTRFDLGSMHSLRNTCWDIECLGF